MNTVLYCMNLALLPVFFLVTFIINMYKLTKQALRWSVSETKNAYSSNRRYYKIN